jgi:hypothetical protein
MTSGDMPAVARFACCRLTYSIISSSPRSSSSPTWGGCGLLKDDRPESVAGSAVSEGIVGLGARASTASLLERVLDDRELDRESIAAAADARRGISALRETLRAVPTSGTGVLLVELDWGDGSAGGGSGGRLSTGTDFLSSTGGAKDGRRGKRGRAEEAREERRVGAVSKGSRRARGFDPAVLLRLTGIEGNSTSSRRRVESVVSPAPSPGSRLEAVPGLIDSSAKELAKPAGVELDSEPFDVSRGDA